MTTQQPPEGFGFCPRCDSLRAQLATAQAEAERYRLWTEALQPGNSPPTHRCKICGALWWLGHVEPVGLSWSLRSPKCGPCCDNAPMGGQIAALAGPKEGAK